MRELSPTEIAAIFADELGPNDEDPRAVAARLSRLWEANQSRADEIMLALQKQAELATARGDGELAGTHAKMLDVTAAQDGRMAPSASDPSLPTLATVQALRRAGTALYDHYGVGERSTGGDSGDAAELRTFDWTECEPVSARRLRGLAERQGWGPLPAFDGWGNDLEYCLRSDLLDGSPSDSPYRFGVRSPGEDGRFDGTTYAVGAFDPGNKTADIVRIDGYFFTWPSADPLS